MFNYARLRFWLFFAICHSDLLESAGSTVFQRELRSAERSDKSPATWQIIQGFCFRAVNFATMNLNDFDNADISKTGDKKKNILLV